mmetsp:Transcript_102896/g.265972  ORF Transcript_102896/g.265972 Transcript_102896/m.265972 type:complete len:526 (-) Transcript_102896:23-1600(-)
MFLTPVVMRKCVARKLPFVPFSLAISTAANIGAACTPIGSPQNMIIHSLSGVPFSSFAARLIMPTLVALVVDGVGLLLLLEVSRSKGQRQATAPALEGTHGQEPLSNRDSLSAANENCAPRSGEEDCELTARPRPTCGCGPCDILTRSEVTSDLPAPMAGLHVRRRSLLVSIGFRSTYRHPHELRQDLADAGIAQVPSYLLPPSNGMHKAPHIAVAELRLAIEAESVSLESLGSPAALAAAGELHKAVSAVFRSGGVQEPPHVTALRLEAVLAKARATRAQLSPSNCAQQAALERAMSEQDVGEVEGIERMLLFRRCLSAERRRKLWSSTCHIAWAWTVFCMLVGLSTSFSALSAAVVLLSVDGRDARDTLAAVDNAVLHFFAAMFVAVAALTQTGLPAKAWDAVSSMAVLSSPGGIISAAAAIVILSNLCGNVPVVMLLAQAGFIQAQESHGVSAETAWLALAWLSSVAGNLTPPGSVANAITADAAKLVGARGPTFKEFLIVCLPLTVAAIAAGFPGLLWFRW